MSASQRTILLLVATAAGCRGGAAGAPLHLASSAGMPGRLALIPAAHIRINARLAPALELRGGPVLRFDGPRTADSAYFASPPSADLPPGATVRGRLRASICRDDETLCRSVTLEL